jgi:hypothetical protein
MTLSELPIGKRFLFADGVTALQLVGIDKGRHVPTGSFKYVGVGEWGTAVLLHESTDKVLVVIGNTHLREVIPLL